MSLPVASRARTDNAPVLIQIVAEQASTSDAFGEVYDRYGIREISPEAAVTIAAMFKSPARPALTAFAAGDAVDAEKVLDDIYDTRKKYLRPRLVRSLDMLGTFVIAAIRGTR